MRKTGGQGLTDGKMSGKVRFGGEFEDREGKKGWIGRSNATDNRIVFSTPFMPDNRGAIVIGFLRSYEGMARASVSLAVPKGTPSAPNGSLDIGVLDGTWSSRTSQVDVQVFHVGERLQQLQRELQQRGLHNFSKRAHIRTYPVTIRVLPAATREPQAGQFKVMTVASC